MKRKNIKNSVLAAAAAAALILTGCQSNAGSSAETEALREQIARLEQQISDLEQRQAAEHAGADSAPGDSTQQSGADAGTSQPTDADTIVGNQSSQNDAAVGNQSLQNDMSVGNQPQQNDTNVGNGQLSDSGTSAGNTQPSQ
ncbi:MAG: hypothetical protein K2P63_04800, partial [Lachnospiraceae bacterium]|nr:hypothetical protein [Lachnospiraceae bacterium]